MPLRGASGSSVHLAGMHLGTLLHVPLLHTWVGMVVMRVMSMVVTMMNIGHAVPSPVVVNSWLITLISFSFSHSISCFCLPQPWRSKRVGWKNGAFPK